ncbi:MAG: MmcQ/YjbR family DNA-binding protein [Elusimicrobia bacterium]|nr:MmcQ/YjbR family DNA-binding protein [Elusimicrobiota bacterium]
MKNCDTLRNKIFQYVKDKYGTNPEYLWAKFPEYAVLRNPNNSKWYAIIMDVKKRSLRLSGEEYIDVIDVKCDPITIGSLLGSKGYLPAYHMNKDNWITMLLDGSIPENEIFNLIDLSYDMTQKKK